MRLIVEEALEAEGTDVLGRGYYERGEPAGYRNGNRLVAAGPARRLGTNPQSADRGDSGQDNPFISQYVAPFGSSTIATKPTATPGWTYGAKTRCGQMSSCEEATFYLTQCGVKSLGRDGDGVPCASLCR